MLNELLLLKTNSILSRERILVKNGVIYCSIDCEMFDHKLVKKVISIINNIHRQYGNCKIPISFDLGNIKILDKLSYILMECLSNCLITNYKQPIIISFNADFSIWTEGILSSPIMLLTTGRVSHIQKFCNKYRQEIYNNHYRRIIVKENDPYYLCKIMAEIDSFLKFLK